MPADMALFERLKELRLKFAKRAGVPAFVIFTDATLRAMSAQKPRTMAEFLKVPGVGGKRPTPTAKRFWNGSGRKADMESSAALPHAARELLLKGGGCAVNFECAPELCAPLRAELARSGRSVGFVRADEGFYDRMDTAAYLRLFERMAGTRGMADAALAAMGLEDARRTPLRRLTPAQRRRLSIAREIVRAPEVFYIEEPLAGQDAEGCRRILEWMDGVPSTGRCCIAATASTRTVYLLPGERYHLDGNGLERLEAAEESAAQGTAVEKIPAKAGETLLLFNPSDIDFAESASGRTALSVRGEEYACALTLEELSVRLERYGFFRCHRSYLVNMQKVQEVVRWTRNSYALRLENGPESGVPLSKGRIDAMRRQYRF